MAQVFLARLACVFHIRDSHADLSIGHCRLESRSLRKYGTWHFGRRSTRCGQDRLRCPMAIHSQANCSLGTSCKGRHRDFSQPEVKRPADKTGRCRSWRYSSVSAKSFDNKWHFSRILSTHVGGSFNHSFAQSERLPLHVRRAARRQKSGNVG